MPIVEVKGVAKVYHQGDTAVHALDNIHLSIDAGSFAAIAGPSGSGKTTLLNMIGGLDLPDKGDVVVDGQHFSEMNQSQLAQLRLNRIGFVFQAYNLIPVLSAVENVEYVMLLQRVEKSERRDRAMAMLDEVGLKEKYNSRPTELSGGQQQRVAVARAIVSNPAIVLADEPTANLDSKTGEGLLKIMAEMNKKRNVTFIFSTHDQMVMDYAHRIVLLRDGKIAADDFKNDAFK
jgi:putative ABC transport system ATP-binding protein